VPQAETRAVTSVANVVACGSRRFGLRCAATDEFPEPHFLLICHLRGHRSDSTSGAARRARRADVRATAQKQAARPHPAPAAGFGSIASVGSSLDVGGRVRTIAREARDSILQWAREAADPSESDANLLAGLCDTAVGYLFERLQAASHGRVWKRGRFGAGREGAWRRPPDLRSMNDDRHGNRAELVAR
jgi:hypothetical protein